MWKTKRDDNVARETTTWQERRQRGNSDVIGQYGKKKLKFPLFFDSMANFVHNAANRTSKFLQYVLVDPSDLNFSALKVLKNAFN
jgi:hypothetical protein